EGFDSKGGRTNFIVDPANSVILDGAPITIANAYIYLQGAVESVALSNRHASPSYRDANFFIQEYQNFYGFHNSNQPSPLKDFMNQLKQVENTGLLSNPTLNQLIKNDFSMQIYLSSTQSPYAKTKPDMGAFVKTTQTNANNICTVSRAITCQDRSR
ncbi:MAG: hypothetical protein K2X66_05655, partial [Cyanobacteria bacterium]|nr:hypothetical protein [Cyanobacteriota bacterium]